MSDQKPIEILPVGPVPLADEESVFTTLYAALGPHLRRISDGQTGDRRDVIGWPYRRLASNGGLEVAADAPALTVPAGPAGGGSTSYPRLRLKPGLAAGDVSLDLGYGEAAKSYVHFAGLKRNGRLRPDLRFLVTLPSATSVSALFIAPEHRDAFVERYEHALLAEIEVLANAITHAELAVQVDLQAEACLAANPAEYWQEDVIAEEVARAVRIGRAVPQLAELGFRLRREPPAPIARGGAAPVSDELLVELANTLAASTGRPVHWFVLPFESGHDSADAFAPLARLRLGEHGEPILGLVRPEEPAAANRARLTAAASHVPAFGITTACDWQSVSEAGLAALLDLLAEVAESAR